MPTPGKAFALAATSAVALAACHTIFDGELHGAIRCTVPDAYGPPHCPIAESCIAGVCASVGAPLGHTCKSDQDCRAPGFCLDPAWVHASGPPRCSLPCCASTDCGPVSDGQVCWAPPEGSGSFCWRGAELGRGALGAARAGETCADGADCRSGVCDQRCVDLCCDDSFCGEQICRIFQRDSLGEEQAWSCGAPAASGKVEECDDDFDCATGRCLPTSAGLSYCAVPCCSSADCAPKVIDTIEYLVACAPVDGVLRACSKLVPFDALPLGAPCQGDGDCHSELCLHGSCSDTCCTDASCGDESRFSCRPVEDGGTWALRCVRK
jgi:hypothetical protein